MPHSERAGQKRKRAEGAIMPTLREAIDPETGEVFRFETSKDVKKRYKQNGATWRPTTGQINAADIWNKQEAEIERKRVLEEKRKKNKAKEALKQEKLREQQQELLAKGRISIEDTWGKANASQMRLNKFFARPKPAEKPRAIIESPKNKRTNIADAKGAVNIEDTENTEDTEDTEDTDSVEVAHDEPDIPVEVQDDEKQGSFWVDEDLYDLFTNSPLTPEEVKKRSPRSPVKDAHSTSSKRKSHAMSQDMMPPPKRARSSDSPEALRVNNVAPTKSPRARRIPPVTASFRVPLQDVSSRANLQNNSKSQTSLSKTFHEAYLPPATQVVRDTLLGLCSQDFADDLEDDLDDDSASLELRDEHNEESDMDEFTDKKAEILNSKSQTINMLGEFLAADNSEFDSNDSGFDDLDEFDDEGIDDESLLALAATQQLQRELFTSSQPTANVVVNTSDSTPNATHQALLQAVSPSCALKSLGESFGMDGLDDADLLEELANYESNIEDCDSEQDTRQQKVSQHSALSSQRGARKKSRVLPWIKNPISFGYNEDAD